MAGVSINCLLLLFICNSLFVIAIYNVPKNENEKPYKNITMKIKSFPNYKAYSQPFYNSNYSKVFIHHKNYTSSLLGNSNGSDSHSLRIYPVYISEEQQRKIENILKEHNSNVIEKDTLNSRTVYKRRIEKYKNIEIFTSCPKGSTGQFVYELSCNQYLDCWNGRGGPRNCAPGTLFNPKTLECDYPNKVECLTGPTARSLTSAKYQSFEQAHCPETFTGLIPNYTDCTKFIQCNDGNAVPKNCPPGTLFDIGQNVCNHPYQATCFSGSQTSAATNYVSYQHREQTGGIEKNRIDLNSQQNHYKISICQPTNQNCPQFDSQQHFTDSNVIYIQYVVCNLLVEDCSNFQQGTYIVGPNGALCNPNEQTCGYQSSYGSSQQSYNNYYVKYVICNVPINECLSAYHTNGISAPLRDLQPPPPPPPPRQQTANYNKICNAGDGNCYQAPFKPVENRKTPPKCPEGFQGITKHPNNCKKFLNCANGITYVQDCGPGTLFNPIILTCDWPYNVDCKDDDEVDTTTTPTTDINPFTDNSGRYSHTGQQQNYAQNEKNNRHCQGYQCSQAQPTTDYNNQQHSYEPFGYPNHRIPDDRDNRYGTPTNCQGDQCGRRPNNLNYDSQQSNRGQAINPWQPANCIGALCPGSYQSQGNQGNCHGAHCGPSPNSNNNNRQEEVQAQWQHQDRETSTSTHRQGNGYWLPSSTTTYPGYVVTPINKVNRTKSGEYKNDNPVDYVDIFNPQETRNYALATTSRTTSTSGSSQRAVWPPPFPDVVSTDINADYVFEYEDGEPVTLAPENLLNNNKKMKSKCDGNDFVCDKKSCIAKNFVCDGTKDCSDGKDEKYCQKYLNEFKLYKNSRLHSLEKQRWNNISQSTCALLCMDNEKFECRSFNFRRVDQTCFLIDGNIGTTGALNENRDSWDYYERRGTVLDCSNMHRCPNGKCLNSDLVCDGFDDCGDRADEKNCRASDFGYDVKLAGAQQRHEGRIEITVFGKTGYVCDDQFSLVDADVLCKEVGFELGAVKVIGNSHYAKDIVENNTLYMMDDIECLGNESSLMHCNFPGWGIHNCDDHEIAGVICRTQEESCSPDYWKCDTGNECVRLPFVCDGVFDCTDNSDEASHYCDLPTAFRLVNGSSLNQGRLEVRHNGIWGSICDDDFNEDAAKIICKHLGYGGSGYVMKDGYFGSSTGPIWLDQVTCFGNETTLEQCTHWEWGEHNCDHSEDVGIRCSKQSADSVDVDAQRNPKVLEESIMNPISNKLEIVSNPPPAQCGYRKDSIFLDSSSDVHFRVVQGTVATPGEYPWQAALRIKSQSKTAHWCGAVVIASKWILTAAHCLDGYPKSAYVLVAGEYDMDENEGTEQQAFIEEYYLHEHFRQGHKMGNDIALIKLKGAGFKLNQDIQPICLPDEHVDYDAGLLNCTISGFGTVQTGKMVYSHKLRAAWIPIHQMDVCKMAHIYGDNIGTGMFCAGDLTGGIDACDGDSGGPLACLHNGVFTLYGLTSWGQRCGYANKPGVYVKVSYYKRWIENIMNIHS